jgi:hypothetical protein
MSNNRLYFSQRLFCRRLIHFWHNKVLAYMLYGFCWKIYSRICKQLSEEDGSYVS